MKSPSDSELVSKIKTENDESALIELASRHSGIFYQTIHRMLPSKDGNQRADEISQRRLAIAYAAAMTFDESKSKFPSWFANRVKYLCLSERSQIMEDAKFEPISEENYPLTEKSPYKYLEQKDEIKHIFDFLPDKLGEQTAYIVKQVYFGEGGGRTYKEIAEELKISNQAVQQAHAKAMRVLKNHYKSKLSKVC